MASVYNSGGARVPCPPPNCTHACCWHCSCFSVSFVYLGVALFIWFLVGLDSMTLRSFVP